MLAAVRHVIDGYDYAMNQGWDEVARICLTHSYPTQRQMPRTFSSGMIKSRTTT